MEIWKDIKGYEGLYQVSNFGNVKSLSKFINNNPKSKLIGYYSKEKLLKQGQDKKNYLRVKLYDYNGEKNMKKVHRLVAQTFISNPNNLPCVNHKDGNKENNNVDNLEWCSYKENTIHAFKNGLIKIPKGKDSKNSKKVYQYDLQGNFIREWYSVSEAQNTLHIKNISTVCYGKRNSAGGYIWKYI